jgi:hypothetical protein
MPATTTNRPAFVPLFGLAMLVILLLGFGPSFYWRPATDRAALPVYLIVHGIAGTAWFVLFVVQALLAGRRQLHWHRRLGITGIGLALVIIVSGAQATLAFTERMVQQGDFMAANGSGERFVEWAIGTSYGGILIFGGLLAAALLLRHSPAAHGRLMLLATTGLLGPAVSRMVGWFAPLPNPVMAVTLLLLVAMLVHDMRTRGRPHVATVLGGLFAYGSIIALNVAGLGAWVLTKASSP